MIRRPIGSHATLAAVAGVLALLLALVALDLTGHALFVVEGSSMEPSIARGSLVVVRPVAPEALAAGDVVTFRQRGAAVTHRIASVDASSGRPVFTTRGDANAAPDPEALTFESRAGLVVAHIPLAGFPLALLQAYGRLIALALAALLAVRLLRERAAFPAAASA